MKVLLITDNHTRAGGAENYFFALKEKLKNHPNMQVHSLGFGPTAAKGEDYTIFKRLTSKVARLIWQIFPHPGIYFKLNKKLKEIQPDVIHIHNVKQYTASLLLAIKSYPIVQTVHDYSVICPTAHNIHKNYEPCATGVRLSCFWQHQVKYNNLSYLAASYAYLQTKFSLKKIVKKFLAPSPLLVDYLKKNNFSDATYVAPFKQEMNAITFDQVKPFHFLFAGNLSMHKGITVLLDEFEMAYKKNNKLTLTIAGEGPEKRNMQKRVKTLGLEKNIYFSEWKENLNQDYTECAAVIFPSLWVEAFGLIITEAMSHARPVIGSNRGSVPWLIDDNSTGLIFNPLVKGELAGKLLEIAGNMELIKKLGVNGHEKLKNLIDNDVVLGKVVAAYEAVLAMRDI